MSDEQETPPEGGKGTDGAEEFKAITSQDELDRVLAKRLERERSKYSDYDEIKAKAAEFDKVAEASKTELQREREAREAAEAELGKYRTREQVAKWAEEIVKDSEVPAAALRGSTREELEEHFNVLKALVKPAPPRRTATPPGRPSTDGEKGRAAAALREMRRGGS